MYSNKFAAKLVNIRQLCKKIMDNLNIFIVLSTYYFTFRIISAQVSLHWPFAMILSATGKTTNLVLSWS